MPADSPPIREFSPSKNHGMGGIILLVLAMGIAAGATYFFVFSPALGLEEETQEVFQVRAPDESNLHKAVLPPAKPIVQTKPITPTCSNECQRVGQIKGCASTTNFFVCGQFDSDACLDLQSQPCATGLECTNGECKPKGTSHILPPTENGASGGSGGGAPANPNNPAPPSPPIENCGNSFREGTESCDGPDLNGQTCWSVEGNFSGGTLSCYANCTFNTSQCTSPLSGMAASISQYGITWYFDQAYPVGQFANGDYWVKGPVTITRITPDFDNNHHGFQINPTQKDSQGFDSRVFSYNAGLVPSLPLTLSGGQSVVKSISLQPLDNLSCRPCLQTAGVLTVLDSIPPGNGMGLFRPPYFGIEKPLIPISQADSSRLPSLAPPGFFPSLEQIRDRFQRVQLDHLQEWVGRSMHPVENMPDYGGTIAIFTNEAALRLMLNDSAEQKKSALVNYTQAGIDWYYMLKGGVHWWANGGHLEGRKLPILFAGIVLDNSEIKNAVHDASLDQFGENGGTYFSPASGRALYGQTRTGGSPTYYWQNIVFDSGSRTQSDPYQFIDGGQRPGRSYQGAVLSQPWKGTALAVRLLDAVDVWNYAPFMEYSDRWVNYGTLSLPDPCAPATGRCAGGSRANLSCTSANELTACPGGDCNLAARWALDYGVLYGDNPSNPGQCIPDNDPSDGTGRFPDLNATEIDGGGYRSGFVDAMWIKYRNPAECGNGITEGSEQCDDGALNGTPGDHCSATCQVINSDSDSGLGAYYNFNNNLSDWSGHNLTASAHGAIGYGMGHEGQALTLDGSSGNCAVVPDYALNYTQEFTVSAFVLTPTPNIGARAIFTRGLYYSSPDWEQFSLGTATNTHFRFSVSDGKSRLSASAVMLVPETWYHIAGTFANNSIHLYVNGNLVASDSNAYFGGVQTTNRGVAIGCRPGDFVSAFEGSIDQVRVYGRVLSETEIAELANG